jgi:hypothetical protein
MNDKARPPVTPHDNNHSCLVTELRSQYRAVAGGTPDWAYPLPPTIPFVGKRYLDSSPRIAIYASAENLSHYERKPHTIPDFLKDDRAWDRHRAAFDNSPPRFFPLVHIAPVENGGLLCAALFLKQQYLEGQLPNNPRDLLEELVVANTAKFSIRTGGAKNRDYAGSSGLLMYSLPFMKCDLEILEPQILLVPRSIYEHLQMRQLVSKSGSIDRLVLIPQLSATVINVHLKKWENEAEALRKQLKGTPVARWTEQISGFRKGFMYRYYIEIARAWFEATN